MAAILNIAQLQKMLNMPKVASSWFFMGRMYSTKICKKTSVMSQNEVMCHILQTTKEAFIIYGRRGGAKILRPIVVRGGNFFLAYFFGGAIFFNALFLLTFFHESDITCIITVVEAQQQHKGMFFF